MNSKTRLDSAVFQLTPTRTRCDLYIIANGKKEKIASGLLNPFVEHLKAAQDQIAEGGYSVLLVPEAGSTAAWFTKCTLESFVRFVSTPEILERVYTIESEILQIEEAIAIQGNTDITVKDQYVKPVASNKGYKPARDVVADDEEMAIVLYKPNAHEVTSSSAKDTNSKVELINVLETRKTVLKKEQGMAFARAVAAGFEIEHVASLLSFAECFGASRLMSGCLRFINLWKQKHESGQWVEVEADTGAEDANHAIPDCFASETSDINTNADGRGVEQQYHGGFPPWGVQGGIPVYPMPYYQNYPGFYPPPPPPYPSLSSIEDPYPYQRRQSMDNNIGYNTNNGSEAVNEERKHKNSGRKKSGRVVIRNININRTSSESESESETSDTDTRNQQQSTSLKRKGKHKGDETLNAKETGHWDAFQTYLLKSAEEGDRESIMENDLKTNTARKKPTAADYDPLSAHAQNCKSYDASGRKTVYNDDDFVMGGRREETTVRDEAVMVSLQSTSGVSDYNNLKMLDLVENKSDKPSPHVVKYEPDALSLMPERDVENVVYDPARDYEMQLVGLHEKTSKQDKKNDKISIPNQRVVRKARPSKLNANTTSNNTKNTLENARARADKLRSYKAELQKMKKEQQDAERKRLEALKMERQKRISARNSNSNRKQLPSSSTSSSKLSPISQMRGSTKFTDSEPGSSSPLQRSKIRPTSINNSNKPSTSSNTSKLTDRNRSAAGSRMTRSLSSIPDTKKEITSVADSQKASSSSIRRLSEPKKINNTPHTSTNIKTRSAEPVSKPKSFKKISVAIDQSKTAAEQSSNLTSQKVKSPVATASQVAKVNLNHRLSDADSNPVIDKTVVMLEHNKEPSSITSKEFNSNHRTGMNNHEVPLPMETVDKGTISVHTLKHPTTSSEVCVEEDEKKYEAPYARVSSFEDQSTRNSEYAKAPNFKFGGNGTEKAKAYVKMENIPEKPQSKGGFGFRRLLKLGKKNHTSSFDDSTSQPPLQKVDTLKSLISQDQTPTPQKSSRNLFSFGSVVKRS